MSASVWPRPLRRARPRFSRSLLICLHLPPVCAIALRHAPHGPESSASATSGCRWPSNSPGNGFHTTGIDLDARKVDAASWPARRTSPMCRQPTCSSSATPAGSTRRPISPIVAELDTVNICVPTPLRKTKDPDMSYIVSAVESIAKHLQPGHAGPPRVHDLPGHDRGSGAAAARSRRPQGGRATSSSPSRPSASTRATRRSRRTTCPKVVGGITPDCTALASALYGAAIETIVPVSSTRVAEMVKLLENTFRAVNIGLVNELALMCDRMDIDVWEVVDAAKTKPFGFMAFYPGPGLGGHCIPIDPFYLSWKAKQSGFDPRFIELAGHINGAHAALRRRQGRRGAQHAAQGAQRIEDSDCRRRLQARHRRHARVAGARRHGPAPRARGAQVSYIDPYVPGGRTAASGRGDSTSRRSTADRGSFGQYDCVVIITDHKSFDYDGDGRRGRPDRRHPERDQDGGAERRSSSGAPRPERRYGDAGGVGAAARRRGSASSRARSTRRLAMQLMVVVEQVELDVRPRGRPSLARSPDRPRRRDVPGRSAPAGTPAASKRVVRVASA